MMTGTPKLGFQYHGMGWDGLSEEWGCGMCILKGRAVEGAWNVEGMLVKARLVRREGRLEGE